MRTSLIEIQQTEQYLRADMEQCDRGVFEARMLVDEGLRDRVRWQQKVYKLLRLYRRTRLKQEIHNVEQQIFTNPEYVGFARHIEALFK